MFGEKNWADYTLYDQMAQNRETALGFLQRLAPAVSAKQRQEAADIRALAKSQGANFEVTPADWNFYAEQIRKQRYALNSDELKPFFEFNEVLTDGVFYAANQLYGLTFQERKDLPTWNADMRRDASRRVDSPIAGRGCGTGNAGDRARSCRLAVRWSPDEDEAPIAIAALDVTQLRIDAQVNPRMSERRRNLTRAIAGNLQRRYAEDFGRRDRRHVRHLGLRPRRHKITDSLR